MRPWPALVVAMVIGLSPAAGWAQGAEQRPFAWDVARAVLIDPTTFAPAIVSHEAMLQDWKSSQVLFARGWVEQNPRYTISGRANDVPVSYQEGANRIRGAALVILQYSAINNAGVRVAERLLISRYPHRKKLIRVLSWAERIAFASILTYSNTADHLRQASSNRRTAGALTEAP
jgi:hypothetical protein